ncbi:MAG: hypothetical protein AAGD25_28460 [Cyanobacteria bacterium P01_F01_bin.150]
MESWGAIATYAANCLRIRIGVGGDRVWDAYVGAIALCDGS